MAKRVLSIILALTMIMSLCCTVSFAAGVVIGAAADTNNTVKGNAGANITVPVSITGNTAGINNYKVYLVYDSNYLSPVVTDSSCLDASIAGFSGFRFDNPSATYSDKTAVAVTYSSANNVTGDQKLFGCIFKIKETITRRCETTVKVYVEELTKMNTSTYANEAVSHTTQDATVIINPDVLTPVTITLSDLTKTYNATAQGANVSLSESVTYTVKYNGSTTVPTNAGIYNVEVTVTQDGFSGTKTGTFVIEPEPITLAANNVSKYEGQTTDPALTVRHVSGTFYGTDTYTGTPVRDSGESIGAYAIRKGSVNVGSNYKLTFNEGLFEILRKRAQDVHIEPVATGKRYGDAPFRWNYTLDADSGCTTKSFSSSDTNVATIDNDGNVTIVGAGTTNLGFYVYGNEFYKDFETSGTLNVAKRPINITIDDKIEVVGSDAPALTYQALADGALATGDTMNLQLERERGNALNTPYKIKVKSLTIKNASNRDVTDSYDINVTEGTYKIINKTLQNVTVGTIATSKTYGDAPFTFTITDNETHITGDISVTSSNSDVAAISSYSEGVVTVNVKKAGTTTITVTRAGDETYADLNVSATLTVAKRPLKITGNTVVEKIGKSVPSLDGQYTIDTTTPLITGDSISGSLVYERDVNMSAMGVYQILIGTLSAGNNYEIDYTPGVLMVVSKTPQTITIEDIPEKTYGDSRFMLTADLLPARPGYIPRFSATVSASATEQLPTNVATVDAYGYVTITGTGTAYITVTEPGDDEYAPASITKKLVVKKAPLTISANVADIVYGQTLTAPTLSYSGFVYRETKDVLTTDATISGVPTGDRIAAGSYTITVSGATAANYDITHTPATLVVSKKPVTVTGVGVFDKAYLIRRMIRQHMHSSTRQKLQWTESSRVTMYSFS